MSVLVDLSGLDRLVSRVRKLERPQAELLMTTWMKIIEEDNRKGVLAGTDKDGVRMAPVTYRPKRPALSIGVGASSRLRNNANGRSKVGISAGFGPHAAGFHNNLTRREYEQLSGPPLAPRGQFSRVITNLKTDFYPSPDGKTWTAYGFWLDVVSTKGRAFLHAHFNGFGRLPRRDLTGVRPEGREKARRAAIAWMSDQIRIAASGSNAA